MPDTFAITVVFIILCTILGAFFRRRSRDRCLLDFSNDLVDLERKDGKIIWGKLRVENTGLELVYNSPYLDKKDGHIETSYILYKNEYPNIQCLVRYLDELTPEGKKSRQTTLEKTYHPNTMRRMKRKVRNFFATVRDSVMEFLNLFLGRLKTATPARAVLSTQDKYISQIKQQLLGTLGTSFEPLLEKHLGKRVILEMTREKGIVEYSGILKDYTSEFLEVMDVEYRYPPEESSRKADLVVPRSIGTIRHLGE